MKKSACTKKILITASNWTHIKNFHLPYIKNFHELGWIVHLACAGAPEKVPYVDESFNLPFQKKIFSLKNFAASLILRKKYKTENYDLIITHTSLAAFFTRLAMKNLKSGTKIINTVHGYLFDDDTNKIKRAIFLTAEKFTKAETDLLLLMNNYDYNLALKYKLGKKIAKIHGIGVDFSRLDNFQNRDDGNERAVLRAKYKIPVDSVVLIFAAEFSARKNQKFLINVMKKLPENIYLVLPGTGILLDECKNQAEKLGLKDRIIFPGFSENVGSFYNFADIAVSSSRSEGLPFNILEAMYMNLPVVASAVKGHTDLLENLEGAKLFPFNDEEKC
ncbi:MAG: glycosyltransferase, partial [Synergistaceae bacterium]|nr:glycosyltransferase [Synergistaceae bacterium]